MEFSSVLKTHTVVVVVVVLSLKSSCYISSIITEEIFISFLLDAASQHLKPNALCDDDADDSCLLESSTQGAQDIMDRELQRPIIITGAFHFL
ncbi:unnamed protein product, partial [Sphagnum troendelagicum]